LKVILAEEIIFSEKYNIHEQIKNWSHEHTAKL